MTDTAMNPVEKLVEPEPSDPVPDLVELVINGNAISLSYWVNYVCKNVLGLDPLTDTTNKIAGDWESLQKAGTAVAAMSDYVREYSRAVSTAARTADSTWDGNAAEAAQAYFGQLTTALDAQAATLKDVGSTIEQYSLSSYYMAQVVCGMLQEVFDYAIILAIKAAASAAMASTGVGAVGSAFTLASGALEAALMIERWQGILGKFTDWVFATEGAASVVLAGASQLSSSSIPQLAGAAYDHPGAA